MSYVNSGVAEYILRGILAKELLKTQSYFCTQRVNLKIVFFYVFRVLNQDNYAV